METRKMTCSDPPTRRWDGGDADVRHLPRVTDARQRARLIGAAPEGDRDGVALRHRVP